MHNLSIILAAFSLCVVAYSASAEPDDTGVPTRDFIADYEAMKAERFQHDLAARVAWDALRSLDRPGRFDRVMRQAYNDSFREFQERGLVDQSFVPPMFSLIRGWLLPWPASLDPLIREDEELLGRLISGVLERVLAELMDDMEGPEWREAVRAFGMFDQVSLSAVHGDTLQDIFLPHLGDARNNALVDAFTMRHTECPEIQFESWQAMLAGARLCGSEPFFISALGLYTIEEMAIQELLGVISDPDHPGIDARAWLDVVHRHRDLRPELDWYIEGERLGSLDAVDAVYRSRPGAVELLGEVGHTPPEGVTHAEVNEVINRLHDRRIQVVRQPVWDRRDFSDPVHDLIEGADPNARDLLWTILPRMSITFRRSDLANAWLQGAMTALAIEAYRADHGGALPGGLERLVPDYLDALPDDPFAEAAGVPLVYRVDGDGRVMLYSRGPNLTDDGGKAIEGAFDPNMDGDLVYLPRL